VSENPPLIDEFLLDPERLRGDMIGEIETVEEDADEWDELNNPTTGEEDVQAADKERFDDDVLPPEEEVHLTEEEAEQLYDQFQHEDNEDYEFDKIVDHKLTTSGLTLTVKYIGETQDDVLEVPFKILKKDVPLELAKYIRDNVVESRRSGHFNTWATNVIKTHGRTVRRMRRYYNVGRTVRARKNRTKAGISRNQRNAAMPMREKYGIRIPQSIRQAILFDEQNKNMLWQDSVAKEINSLKTLDVFSFKSASHVCSKSDGWSYAPMHMIFDVKREDLRHKSRLVVGGHVIDSSKHNTYSSTVQDLSVRLLQLITIRNGLSIMTGDISNAFCTAPIAEKIYTRAGPEFGAQQGCLLILKRALYGLKTAS